MVETVHEILSNVNMNNIRLKVRNFGPIKNGYEQDDGFLTIPKVTLFCGPQGSGKSTITKLLSSLMWLEKAAYVIAWNRSEFVVSDPSVIVSLMDWHGISSYFQPETEIVYKGDLIDLHYNNGILRLTPSVNSGGTYEKPRIMYMPAERNFLHYFKNSAPVEQPPLLILHKEYSKAEKIYASGFDLPINGYRFALNAEHKPVILNLHATGTPSETPLSASSSGIQSILPILLVSEYLQSRIGADSPGTDMDSMSLTRNPFLTFANADATPCFRDSDTKVNVPTFVFRANRAASCFTNVVEEPEQNLFPPTQRNVLRRLLSICGLAESNRLILSTHSPYIVSDLIASTIAKKLYDLADMAGTKSAECRKLVEEIYSPYAVVDSSQVCLFETNYDGVIRKSMDDQGRLSDKNFLNYHLQLSSKLFDHMLSLRAHIENVVAESAAHE